MGQMAIICPSRTRPHNIQALYESWQETNPFTSKLIVCLDDDDAHNYEPFIDGVIYEVNPRMRLIPTLNFVANKYCKDYRVLGFVGDDHRFRTPYWDMQVYNRLKGETRNSILYGNDLLQGQALPTAVFLRSEIVQRLGYMAPPGLIHMFADNFWKDLGTELGSLVYLKDVIIEHCHHVVGKAEHDALYDEVNGFTNRDMAAYEEYLALDFHNDLDKLR
jgi:hypothetical protein